MNQRSTQRGGWSAVYLTVVLVVLIALVSLAVDYGRVQLVKTELQRAADAAAWAAAAALPSGDSAARAAATSTAALNSAEGTPVELHAGDIVCGLWNATQRRVEPGGWGDAVQVTATRAAARGNAVPLFFARVLGVSDFDVSATAVARVADDRVGIIGLDGIENKGGARIDSFDPALGPYAQSQSSSALVGSNGNIVLSNNSIIRGDAHPGVGMAVIGGMVTGSRAPLATPLDYPAVSAGTFSTVNDNHLIPAKFISGDNFKMGNKQSLTLPGGNYYFKDFTMGGGSNLTFTGPATFYLTGAITLSGHISTAENRAQNLTINMIGQGAVDLSMVGGTQFFVNLYGPQSPISISGTGDFYGSVVGKTIAIGGNGGIHHDLSIRSAHRGVVLVR